MIKILIADDHPIVRQGLKHIVEEMPNMVVGGEARNAHEALSLVRNQKWDIVLLDISMPGRSGLEMLHEMHREYPSLPVLVLSMHPEEQFAVRVLKAGAAGYMTKETAPEELVKAIKKVVQGGRYISPSLAERLAVDITRETGRPPHEALSDREFQVLRLMASGKTVTEIAKDMVVSVKTVSTYRTRLLEKMAMKTNAELIHYAIKHRLVE